MESILYLDRQKLCKLQVISRNPTGFRNSFRSSCGCTSDVDGSVGFGERGDLDVSNARCALRSVTSMPCRDCFPDEVELAQM